MEAGLEVEKRQAFICPALEVRQPRSLRAVRRLLTKCQGNGNGSCWTWTGAVDPDGYPKMFYAGANRFAHRLSYALFNGALPPKQTVHHKCGNRSCINPDHLSLLSHESNCSRPPLDDVPFEVPAVEGTEHE
jgi:hypothetical protein